MKYLMELQIRYCEGDDDLPFCELKSVPPKEKPGQQRAIMSCSSEADFFHVAHYHVSSEKVPILHLF